MTQSNLLENAPQYFENDRREPSGQESTEKSMRPPESSDLREVSNTEEAYMQTPLQPSNPAFVEDQTHPTHECEQPRGHVFSQFEGTRTLSQRQITSSYKTTSLKNSTVGSKIPKSHRSGHKSGRAPKSPSSGRTNPNFNSR